MSKGFASNYRIVLLATGLFVSFVGLGVRLVWLHVIDRDTLLGPIVKARSTVIPDYARRGDVLDANNNILATSRSLMVLGVDPRAVRIQDQSNWPQLAALIGMPLPELKKILTTKYRPAPAANPAPAASPAATPPGLVINISVDAPAAVTPSRPNDSVPTLLDNDETELDEAEANGQRSIRWAKLSDQVSESLYAEIMKLKIPGVYGNRVYRRTYPHGQLAAHVIGFMNRAPNPTTGKQEAATGIERYTDFYLRGQDGWRETEKDGRRRELAQFRSREVPRADGYTVKLSLDINVQDIVEQELTYIAQRFKPEKATIIVSDPATGFILGMGNYPTFDLNEYGKVPKEAQASMKNVAVTDIYEPGSTFKIVAASGAINEGLATPDTLFDTTLDRIEYRGKSRSLPGEDHHFATPRAVPVSQVISYSSNRGAVQLAMKLGEERFFSYARAFGFGQLTGFPVGGEVDGILAPPDKWDGLTVTRMPIGHSVASTPLQMHMAMGVIASGGNLLRPQVIKEIRTSSGEVIYRYDTMVRHRVISPTTAHTMARMLQGVASAEGTALTAVIPGFEVAGKTGTTKKIINGRYSERHHVASFVGFFPASNPQIAISVIVDNADANAPGGVAYGSNVAAPSFKKIGEQLISYRKIVPPAEPAPPLRSPGRNSLAANGGRR